MSLLSPTVLILLVLIGASAGFLAGLLGIGGGVLLVPLFLWAFPLIGFPEASMVHTALGTSLAIILPTAISSTLGHRKRGNVEWHMVFLLAIGGILGAFLGASMASLVSGPALRNCFGGMLVVVGLKFLLFHPRIPPIETRFPNRGSLVTIGLVGGTFSSFFGIGGGVVAVPLMVIVLRQPIHLAVGNSSALIVVSSFFGALGYVFHGLAQSELSPLSMGYVNVPVAAIITSLTIISARFGVRVASRTSQDKLMKGFAVLLMVVGLRMAFL